MAKKSLEELNVKSGDKIIVRGKVSFSEIAERVEGEKLEKKIKKQESIGIKYPETKPHFALALVDVSVHEDYTGTPLATYIGQDVYQNKHQKAALNLVTKSPFAPNIYLKQADGSARKVELEAELAPDQEVEVLIEAYTPKNWNRMGASFNAVLLPTGEIKYYSNNASSEIEAFGLKPSVETAPAQATAPVESAPVAPTENGVPADAVPNAFAGTNNAPVQPAAQNPFATSTGAAETPVDGGIVTNPFA